MGENQSATLFEILFLRILKGEILSDLDIKNCAKIFYIMAIDMDVDEVTTKKNIKKFRQSIPNFLLEFDKELDEFERLNNQMHKFLKTQQNFIATLPPYASSLDSPEMILFIKSLKDDTYSFSAAAKHLGITRQTLKDYADKGLHGFEAVSEGRVMKLRKQDMINYYRDKYFKNYDPFEAIANSKK